MDEGAPSVTKEDLEEAIGTPLFESTTMGPPSTEQPSAGVSPPSLSSSPIQSPGPGSSIARLSYRHDAIINWLIMHSDRPQNDCAAYFGYSASWLSTIINSDVFQAAYRARCEELGEMAIHSTHNKLAGIAGLAMEKTIEKLNANPSERFISETRDSALDRLGLSPKKDVSDPTKHLHIHVDAQALKDARSQSSGGLREPPLTLESSEEPGSPAGASPSKAALPASSDLGE